MAEENKIFPGVRPIDFEGPEVPKWIRRGPAILDDLGNLVAGAVDRTPVGAATNWLDRNTGDYLGKADTALHNLFAGENLSLAENRKRRADIYAKAVKKNPKTAFATEIGVGLADPTMRLKGIPGVLGGGALYGTAYGYADAVDKADREMQPVNYGALNATGNAAVGAGLAGIAHGAINNPLSRKGIDWAGDKIANGRNVIADALRKLTPIPDAEKKAIGALRETEQMAKHALSPAELSNQDLRAKVVATDEPIPNAVGRQREADFGFDIETGKNNFTGTRRDSDASIERLLSQEKQALNRADQKLKATNKTKDKQLIEQAQKEYTDALNAYNKRYDEITGVRNAYNQAMFEGTPTEHSMAQVNPARKYSEETGALRGQLGEGYNPEQVATPELGQARIVMRNAELPENFPNQRAMWRGDLNLRRSGVGQDEAENIYSRLSRGTTDPITGSSAARTAEQQGRQGTIFERNKKDLYDELSSGVRFEDSAIGRMLRPKERPDPLKNWSSQQKDDLTNLLRDPSYMKNALSGNAETKLGGLSSTQQENIAKELARPNLTQKTGAALGNILKRVPGELLHPVPVVRHAGSKITDIIPEFSAKARAIPQDTQALGRELDRVLKKINGLPETGKFYKPNALRQRAPLLAANAAQSAYRIRKKNNQSPDVSHPIFPKLTPEEARKAIQNHGKPEKPQTTEEIIKNAQKVLGVKMNPKQAEQVISNGPRYQGDWQAQIKKAAQPDFWNGLGKVLAGIIALKTGARFDYNINDRIKSLQDNYGLDAATAESVARDRDAYQKLIAQKEDAREKDRIAQRNASLKGTQGQKMEIKVLKDGSVLGINPYTGEKTIIEEGSGDDKVKLSAKQQTALNTIADRNRGLEAAKSNLNDLKDAVEMRGDAYINPLSRILKGTGTQWGVSGVDNQWLAHRRVEQILRTVPIMLQGIIGSGDSKGSDKLRQMIEESHAVANEPAEVINDYIDRLTEELNTYIDVNNKQREYVISGYGGNSVANDPYAPDSGDEREEYYND